MNPRPLQSTLRDSIGEFLDELIQMLAALSAGDFKVPFPKPEDRPGLEDVYSGFQILREDLRLHEDEMKRSYDAALNLLEDLDAKSKALEEIASIPQHNPAPIIELGEEFEFRYCNLAAKRIFPDLKELHLKHPALLLIKSEVAELAKHQKPVLIREFPYGTKVYQKNVTYNSEKKLVRLYIFEITEKKHLEEIKDHFIMKVSHEMRTPLSVILSAVSSLNEGICGPLNENQTRFLTLAHKNCARLSRVINNILDLSRLESGRALLNLVPIKILEIFKDLASTFAKESDERKIKLEFNAESHLSQIVADSDFLFQLLINLIGNAMRYAKTQILVHACDDLQGSQILSVFNDGSFIAPAYRQSIFDKFEQVNRVSGGSGYKGTGLGLSICKEIVELHQGKIWVDSDSEKGTTFFVSLPRVSIVKAAH